MVKNHPGDVAGSATEKPDTPVDWERMIAHPLPGREGN